MFLKPVIFLEYLKLEIIITIIIVHFMFLLSHKERKIVTKNTRVNYF